MPILFAPTPPVGKINKIVPISEGGTGGASVAEALVNLGAIDASNINQPGGPLGLDDQGKLTIDTSAISLSAGPAVNGPLSVTAGSVTNYQITNFHAATIYSVTAIGGSVVQNGETIIYTAPGNLGSGGFVVNGKTYAIDVTMQSPNTPAITSPINGATNIGSVVAVTSSAFSFTDGSDTHTASDWQISTSPTFDTILYQSLNDTVNKTSWTSGTLTASTQYYIRVRHKGTTYGYSQWSSVVSVTTNSSFLPTGEKQKIGASDAAANDAFGFSVSLSGDGSTALVGADGKSTSAGAAYIFTKSGSTWSQQAKLTASDAATNDFFGYSVSLSSDGSTALVGASYKSSSTGAAYIFTKSGSTWTEQAKLTASDAADYDRFGWSVSLSSDGSTALVGVSYKSSATGAAYIFTRSGSTWTQQAMITAGDAATGHYFGHSVSLSSDGSTALVGAYGKSSNTGAAYIFTKSGSTWTQQQNITASDASIAGDYFGWSVSLSADGSTALVGASYKSSYTGAAYIFTRSGSTWTQQSKLTASDAATNDFFGYSVSLSSDGSTALVGARGKSSNTGAAYIFTRSGSTWTQQAKLTASDAATVDNFGYSVSLSTDGSTVLVGAYQEDPSSISAAGSAYFYA